MALQAQGTIFEVSTGAGQAIGINAASSGATTILTIANAAPISVGDVVTIVGNTWAPSDAVVVIAKSGNDIEVAFDSSSYTSLTPSGSVIPAVYNQIAEVTDWSFTGAQASAIDSTHLRSVVRTKLYGLRSGATLNLSFHVVHQDQGQAALRDVGVFKWFKIIHPDSRVYTFEGAVNSYSTQGGVDQLVEGSASIEARTPLYEV